MFGTIGQDLRPAPRVKAVQITPPLDTTAAGQPPWPAPYGGPPRATLNATEVEDSPGGWCSIDGQNQRR